jgi:hypothetical protein
MKQTMHGIPRPMLFVGFSQPRNWPAPSAEEAR